MQALRAMQLEEANFMARLLRHTSFLIVLAGACYVMAIYVTGGRIGFITFLVVGLIAELTVWLLGAYGIVGSIYAKATRNRNA